MLPIDVFVLQKIMMMISGEIDCIFEKIVK